MDDPNLELGGASEEATELELEPTSTEKTNQGGDPLDEISDPVVRDQAKRDRAIARRATKKDPVVPAVEPVVAPKTDYLSKADFEKANERKAILTVIADDPEVKANWSEIMPFYTPRRGKVTPEDIAEDIKDAVTLFKARNPDKMVDTSADVLTTTPVVKTGGGSVPPKTPTKLPDPPNFHLPKQPKDWYKPAETAK